MDLLRLRVELFGYERVWSLHGAVTAYDAYYVALAEALDAPLATIDLAPDPHTRSTLRLQDATHPDPTAFSGLSVVIRTPIAPPSLLNAQVGLRLHRIQPGKVGTAVWGERGSVRRGRSAERSGRRARSTRSHSWSAARPRKCSEDAHSITSALWSSVSSGTAGAACHSIRPPGS